MALLSLLLGLGSGTNNRSTRRDRRSQEQRRRRRPRLLKLESLETRQLLSGLSILSANAAYNNAQVGTAALTASAGHSWSPARASTAFDGTYEYATAGATGDYATFTFNNVAAGTYELGVDSSACPIAPPPPRSWSTPPE